MPFLVSAEVQDTLPEGTTIDPTRIALVGSSAGGYLCRLAASHAEPKPAVMGLLFGMGGDMMNGNWLRPHVPHFFTFPGYARPPLGSAGPDYLVDWFGEGTYLDYFTGQNVSDKLRGIPEDERMDGLPEELKVLFPELRAEEFPPTFMIHGREDSVVLLQESEKTFKALQAKGMPTVLRVVEGEHSLRALEASTEYKQSPHFPALAKEMVEWLSTFIAPTQKTMANNAALASHKSVILQGANGEPLIMNLEDSSQLSRTMDIEASVGEGK